MAQSLTALPSEQVLVECRALVFFYDIQLNKWTDVGEQNVFCRIQLLCTRPPGSTGLYRILARLESTGTIILNTPLTDRVTYVVTSPSWHQIRLDIGIIYGLRVSNEAEGKNFSVIIHHTLRSLQGTQRQPPWPMPPDQQAAAPVNLSATAPVGTLPHSEPPPQDLSATAPAAVLRNPDPSPQDGGRAQRRRDFDVQIDSVCSALSDAILNAKPEQAIELVRKMASRKLNLSIKLKNPTLVTMDSGGNTITIRVVVEDKESSGGTFSMKVSPTSTVERLQQEVFDRYGFPVQVQKWIVGKRVPKPQDTLHDLHVRQSGTTVFLYLLSGKAGGLRRSDVERFGRGNTTQTSSTVSSSSGSSGMSSAAVTTTASGMHMRHAVSTPNLAASIEPPVFAAPNRAEQLAVSLVGSTLPASGAIQQENSGPTTLPIHVGMNISAISDLLAGRSGGQGGGAGNPPNPPPQEFVNNLEPVEQQAQEDGNVVGWTCEVCTYINKPTRPGCEMCSSDRPANYVVPAGMQLDERERSRIAAAEREEALFQQAEQTRQQEEQVERQQNLAALLQTAQQNLIPNQEEFDCGICYLSVEPGQGVVLRECLHRFCRDCLSEHIRHATDPEVQCPHQDDDYACHATITGQEIQAVGFPF